MDDDVTSCQPFVRMYAVRPLIASTHIDWSAMEQRCMSVTAGSHQDEGNVRGGLKRSTR